MRKCFVRSVLVFSLVLLACAEDPSDDRPAAVGNALRILSFTASETIVDPGTAVELRWTVANASDVQLTANGDPVDIGDEAEGTVSYVVEEKTVFRLEAYRGGETARRDLTVDVRRADTSPRIVAFRAEPSEIEPGASAWLRWETRNAESVQIVDDEGKAIPTAGQAAVAGEVEVSPTRNTTYRLSATGPGGTVERSARVTVRGAPSLEVAASPAVVDVGQEVTLSWKAVDAVRLFVQDRAGTVLLDTDTEFESSMTFVPQRTTTYEVRAVGEWNETVRSVEVQVRPQILAFEVVDTNPIAPGKFATLRWETAGATELLVSNLDPVAPVEERIVGLRVDQGTVKMPVGAEGKFRLVAIGGAALQVEASTEGQILKPPVLGHFAVTPEIQSQRPVASMVVVEWAGIENATSVRLETDTVGRVGIFHPPFADGSLELAIPETTTFTFIVSNDAGEVRASATAVLVPLPTIRSFDVFPAYASPGEPVTLSWEVEDAERIAIDFGGTTLPIDPTQFVGSYVHVANETGNYRLVATNVLGGKDEEIRGLTIGPMEIVDFASNRDFLTPTERLELRWTTRGGVELSIFEDDEPIFTTSDPAEMASGKWSIARGELGTHTYRLRLVNGLGQTVEDELDVLRTDGPVLLSATMPTFVCIGKGIEVSWNATRDVDGVLPDITVSLNGNDYTFPARQQSTVTLPNQPPGIYQATITASTPGTTPHSRTFTVEIDGMRLVDFGATPSTVSPGQPVTVRWNAVCADKVTIPDVREAVEVHDSPFVDIFYDDAPFVPLEDSCGTIYGPEDEGCLVLNFPGGFSFPFDGVERTAIKLYANGVASFDLARIGESWDNQPLPSPSTPWAHLAIFWDDLFISYFEQGFYYMLTNRGGLLGLIIQWGIVDYPFGNLFQMVLWEDGSFDYRYDDWGASASSATIGYQNTNATIYGVLSQFQDPPGGIGGRSWRWVEKSLPPQGSLVLHPAQSRQVLLKVHGATTIEETLDITVQ